MAKTVVSGSDISSGQLKDLFRQIHDGSLNGYHLDALLNHRNPFEFPSDPVELMKLFWKQVFDLNIDLEGVIFPEERKGFSCFIIMPKGLTYKYMWSKILLLFPSKSWAVFPDLPDMIDLEKEARITNKTYAIRIRRTVDADDIHANKSADMIAEQGIDGITLLERMVAGVFFWWLSGKRRHLDYSYETLCTGSRDINGDVPTMCYDAPKKLVFVSAKMRDSKYAYLRTREVVAAT